MRRRGSAGLESGLLLGGAGSLPGTTFGVRFGSSRAGASARPIPMLLGDPRCRHEVSGPIERV